MDTKGALTPTRENALSAHGIPPAGSAVDRFVENGLVWLA